jgi:hypothetical protein
MRRPIAAEEEEGMINASFVEEYKEVFLITLAAAGRLEGAPTGVARTKE